MYSKLMYLYTLKILIIVLKCKYLNFFHKRFKSKEISTDLG